MGGCSERDESPLTALRREVREEIGLSLLTKRFSFAGVRFVAPRAGRVAYVQVYFRAKLGEDEIRSINLQPDEIAEHRFVPVAELSGYADQPRMKAAIELITRDRVYLENEVAILDPLPKTPSLLHNTLTAYSH